jgi:fructose/tagatose bisphosphate aldolase
MKYINTIKLNNLDDTKYEFLSNLCTESLGIVDDKTGIVTEIEIGQLKEDEDGVIYAPTSVHEFVDLSSKPANYSFEMFQELRDYTPLATILKERKGTLA